MNNIGVNIQSLRKEKKINQEQLAGAIGVSVAAVSKWETGSSYPDITLLPTIADYFGVSIDYIMGYTMQDGNLDKIKETMHPYMAVGDYKKLIPLLEDAIKRYPNDCELQYLMAHYLSDKATADGSVDKELAKTAITHFERALFLSNDKAYPSKANIYNSMVTLYIFICDYDKAIDIMENINDKKIKQTQLSECYIKKGDITKAKSLLQKDLDAVIFNFRKFTSNLAICFRDEGDNKNALELLKTQTAFYELFVSDTPNFCDRFCLSGYSELAGEYKQINDCDNMWACLEKAVYHAIRFDKKPSYAIDDIKFCAGIKFNVTDSSSNNACHSLIIKFENDFNEFSGDANYKRLLDSLKKSATDKKSSGIWE